MTYQPSPIGPAQPTAVPAAPAYVPPPAPATGGYAPSAIHGALIDAGAHPDVATNLTAISGAESHFGASPISPPNKKDGSRDHGVFQVNDKAWPYQNVERMPLSQQAAIALHIWNTQGPGAWTTYSNGAYKQFLKQVGSNTVPAGGGAGNAQVPPPPPPPLPQQPSTVGGALGALTQPDQSGQSPTQNAQKMFGGGGPSGGEQAASPQGQLQEQMAAVGSNARQQQIYMQAQQLAAALQQNAMKPISWGTAPPGSGAGPQVPGTTLTSMGG